MRAGQPRIAGTKIAGAIIAGGQSSRMQAGGVSGDKFLQPLGSAPVIAHVIARLQPQVDTLFINSKGDLSRFAAFGLPAVKDIAMNHGGPLVGLLTCLAHASPCRLLLTSAADTPFLPCDLASNLIRKQAETGARIILARSNERIHPIVGLWHTDLVQDLEKWLQHTEKASIFWFAKHIGFEVVNIPLAHAPRLTESYDPFFNINLPDDLLKAREINEALQA
ncbi:molybdopterin-guanine dinucleotide biosynthesis protein A [Brucella sp. NF 2653]|uniref:molybdenum cofactor guanylyltransferase n=2 Tax=Brucella TaxID=234 RepID=UPI0001B47BFE|nr:MULTISPECIES: molybdenum cofactor guanylyltransferase [unclassified Brucella]EEZ32898.1 molybdopterin-guanine dinucleotide biosynthesis protein A [Brucella sp. 83/13]EFM62201.1 molybdopterin-guanine dinucleotide biosynthesis protein A [Brucella sp. NF 2653]